MNGELNIWQAVLAMPFLSNEPWMQNVSKVLALDCVNCADHIAVLYLLLYLEQERNDAEATTL
jgi:hypothetical protein